MNPLGSNLAQNQMPQEYMEGIKQVKSMMSMVNGNPMQILQQMGGANPMVNQVLQMCKTQNPQDVFMSLCKQKGVDPNAILRELQR